MLVLVTMQSCSLHFVTLCKWATVCSEFVDVLLPSPVVNGYVLVVSVCQNNHQVINGVRYKIFGGMRSKDKILVTILMECDPDLEVSLGEGLSFLNAYNFCTILFCFHISSHITVMFIL